MEGQSAVATAVYVALSSTMLIVNKAAVQALPYPLMVTNAQMIVSVVVISAMRQSSVVSFPLPDPGKLRDWVGVTVAWVMPIVFNMKALQLLNIETVLVFRTLTSLGVALGDHIWLGQKIEPVGLCGLVAISLGGVVYAYFDVQFALEGYIYAGCYWGSLVVNMLYTKHVFNQHQEMSSWEKSWLSNLMTVPALTLYCLLFEQLPQGILEMSQLSVYGALIVLLSCFMGLGLSVAGTKCRDVFSATSFDVLGNMNKIVSILLSRILLGSVMSTQSAMGLLLAMTGGMLYSPLGKKLFQLCDPAVEQEQKATASLEDLAPLKQCTDAEDEIVEKDLSES